MLYRSNLLENSFAAMAGCSPKDWAREIMVMFHKEEGLDYGALTRDWLLQLLDSMVPPELGLFCQVGAAGAAHPSPTSVVQPDHLAYFRLFGHALGKVCSECPGFQPSCSPFGVDA